MVTNLGTPTNDTDAADKKYVDYKKCKFKDKYDCRGSKGYGFERIIRVIQSYVTLTL